MKKINFVLSPKYTLLAEDIKSILRGAVLMALGTGSVYALEALAKLDFGQWTPVVAIFTTMVINAIRKWMGEHSYQK